MHKTSYYYLITSSTTRYDSFTMVAPTVNLLVLGIVKVDQVYQQFIARATTVFK